MLGKKLPFFSAPPTDFSQTLAPPRTTLIFGSTAFMASTMLLYFTQYWFSDMWPACPGAVHLVADRPAADIEGLGTAVLRAHSAHAGVDGAIAVFNFLGRLARRSESAVDRQIGLGSDQSVEGDEVMQAHVVRLVPARRALVTIAKTVAPVVSGDKVAAGPLEHFEAFFFEEADHAGVESLHVIGRHQRSSPDVECAAAGTHDFQARIGRVGRRRELGRGFAVLAR